MNHDHNSEATQPPSAIEYASKRTDKPAADSPREPLIKLGLLKTLWVTLLWICNGLVIAGLGADMSPWFVILGLLIAVGGGGYFAILRPILVARDKRRQK